MKKQIEEYLSFLEEFFSAEHSQKELCSQRELLLRRIELYQHERLVHLMVTLAFAVLFMLSLFMTLTFGGVPLVILTVLLLVLLVPYIAHYYFLENSVQRMYLYYYKSENAADE